MVLSKSPEVAGRHRPCSIVSAAQACLFPKLKLLFWGGVFSYVAAIAAVARIPKPKREITQKEEHPRATFLVASRDQVGSGLYRVYYTRLRSGSATTALRSHAPGMHFQLGGLWVPVRPILAGRYDVRAKLNTRKRDLRVLR